MPKVDSFSIDDRDFLFILESKHKKNFSMNYHTHNFYEIAFVLEGCGKSQILHKNQVQEIDICSNTLLLWDGKIPHRAVDAEENPLQQLIIIFDSDYLLRIRDHMLIVDLLKKENPVVIKNALFNTQLKPMMREILNEMRVRDVGKDSIILSILCRILINIVRVLNGDFRYKNSAKDKRITRSLEYIHQNFYMNISMQETAELCTLSQRQFSEVFKKETGQTFTQYLNSVRMEHAKEALRHTGKTVTDIAFEVGYDDISYFNRRFKQHEGMSPRQYKQKFK